MRVVVVVVVLVAASTQPILIVSGGVRSPDRAFAKGTQENHQTFADIMGYRYEPHFVSASDTDSTKQPYWHKIAVVLKKLAERNMFGKVNKVVVWLDDDAVVVKMDDMIERYLERYSEDVIVAKDADDHAYVNSGVLIVRNSAYAVQFFREVLRRGELTRNVVQNSRTFQPELQVHERWLMKCDQAYDCMHEQQAMKELILGKEEVCVPDWDVWNHKLCSYEDIETTRNWSKVVAVVPQRDKAKGLNLNTYSRDFLDKKKNNNKIAMNASQDFVVQATGLPPAIRESHLEQLFNMSSSIE